MNSVFKKLATEIKFKMTPSFEFVKVQKAELLEDNVFHLDLESREIIPFVEMEKFLVALNGNFKYDTKFQFNATSTRFDEKIVREYLYWITNDFLKMPSLGRFFADQPLKIVGENVEIELQTSLGIEKVELEKNSIDRIMRKFGFLNFEIIPVMSEVKSDILEEEQKRNFEQAIKTQEISKRSMKVQSEGDTFKRKSGYEKVEIVDLANSHSINVTIEGEIFKKESIETKTKLVITQLSVTDYKDAVYIKMFARTDEEKEKNEKYEEGQYVTIQGQYQIDSFTKEPTIIARKITIIENPYAGRVDDAKRKRVELNTKTKMSTMDGISSPLSLVKRAKEWGHSAIAIVDSDSVQSFPDFYNATKDDKNFKPIFGASFSVIEEQSKAIINHKSKDLIDDEYVVFDLETTGLSPIIDEIIEFGGVVVKDGKIVDSKQFFIKPKKAISKFTTELTGITQEMVDSAKTEEEAIVDIFNFMKGRTLVAHNASFDITFVNEKLMKYGHKEMNEAVIDSMIVDRIIHPEAKRYRLGNVATRFTVNYDSTTAHRADYDAQVLALIWIKMLHHLIEIDIKSQLNLYNFNSSELLDKQFANSVSLIAKNQKGLKELFFLATNSFTTNYHKGAKIFLKDLKARKNILMGSGGLGSRLLDRLFFGSKKQVEEEIKLYDYIEIQPLHNFKHFVNRGMDEEDLKNNLLFLVNKARELGKPVVATSDSRYLDPKDKIYHEIYINAKGLGGTRHKLFRFKESSPIYPDQYLLTTNEMVHAMSFLGDTKLIQEVVIDNTIMISEQVEKIQVIKDKLYTPKFEDSDAKLSELAYKTAREIYGDNLPEIVEERLKRELEPIIKYGFAVIYWISHLLVDKSLQDGYLVGSRGSVGSSLVATMTKITEVNPLSPHYVCAGCKHSEFLEGSTLNSGYDLPEKMCPNCNKAMNREGQNIPFETFLGFNADKVPDIDLNFSGEYQPIVHNEVKKLFGEKHAFRAGTISTVAEKTAFGYVKGWAEETGKSVSRPFTEYIAKGVAGTKRTSGQHPGGIIVIPSEFDVEDFSPINYPANDVNANWKTTHFDFHAIHDNVLKLDLLGHDDPTAIKYLEKLTGVKATTIPFSDPKVISLFSSTKALGVTPEQLFGESTGAMGIPEFGTKFVRGMLKSTKVESFGDLISVSGLSHGTDVWANNAELLIRDQNLSLGQTISCRDNIMTDLLAKDIEPIKCFTIMEKVRKGKGVTPAEEKIMKEHGVEDWYIDSLNKIKYMFPKAHATAYVMMAWRIAWFKVYHPLAYYATYFTTRADVSEISTLVKDGQFILERLKDLSSKRYVRGPFALSNKEKSLIPILEIANEMNARGFRIKNISLKKSHSHDWTIDEDGVSIIPPFSSIDGLGDSVAISISEARKEAEFTSKEDLLNRTSVNKTTLKKFEELGVTKGLNETNQLTLDLFNI